MGSTATTIARRESRRPAKIDRELREYAHTLHRLKALTEAIQRGEPCAHTSRLCEAQLEELDRLAIIHDRLALLTKGRR